MASGNTLARAGRVAAWYRAVSRSQRLLRPAYSPKVFYLAGHPANQKPLNRARGLSSVAKLGRTLPTKQRRRGVSVALYRR